MTLDLTGPHSSAAGRAALIERLEVRRQLTTLFPGDTFIYSSFDNESLPEDADDFIPVEFRVEGDAGTTVDVFGSTVSGQLSDLSGVIVRSSTGEIINERGGLGGRIGALPLVPDELLFFSEFGTIQNYSASDLIGFDVGSDIRLAPQSALAVSSLATNTNGDTFGLQLSDDDGLGGPRLDLLIFNTDRTDFDPLAEIFGIGDASRTPGNPGFDPVDRGNVGDAIFVTDLRDDVIAAANAAPELDPTALDPMADPLALDDVVSIFGADFRSTDPDTLVAGIVINTLRPDPDGDDEDGPATAEVNVPAFFEIDISDLTAPVVSYLGSGFSAEQGQDADDLQAEITAFTFVENGLDEMGDPIADSLLLHGTFRDRTGEGGEATAVRATTGVVLTDGATGTSFVSQAGIREVVLFEEVVAVTSLEYRPTDGLVYALSEPGDDQQFFNFDPNFNPENEDELPNFVGGVAGSSDEDDIRGEMLDSLTFDPTLFDPLLDDGDGIPEAGEIGTFLSFDSETDELLQIDVRPRGVGGALSIYSVVVNDGTLDTIIAVQPIEFEDDDDTEINEEADVALTSTTIDRLGFTGTSGTLSFYGDDSSAVSPDGSGLLFLGLKYVVTPEMGDPFVQSVASLDPEDGTEGTSLFTGPLFDGEIRPGLYVEDSSLGVFNFAGTVTGNVRIEGALGEFVAGQILTGNALGNFTSTASNTVFESAPVYQEQNFAVFGDVDNIVSIGSIGDNEVGGAIDFSEVGAPDSQAFSSGTDIAIAGRVGAIRSTVGSVSATIEVVGDVEPEDGFIAPTLFKTGRDVYQELELQVQPDGDNIGQLFQQGEVITGSFFNDSFTTFEPVGARPDGTLTIQGLIDTTSTSAAFDDFVDYFGVGLVAGQTVTVDLDFFGNPLAVGIFDPDGRLVATDFEDNRPLDVLGAPFQFTTKTAGNYRIAIGYAAAPGFNDGAGLNGLIVTGFSPYELNLEGLGDMSVGGIVAAQRIYAGRQLGTVFFSKANVFDGVFDTIRIRQDDLGIVDARNESFTEVGILRVTQGNLRHLGGSGVGGQDVGPLLDTRDANVRVGFSIGRVEATGVAGDAAFYGGDVFLNFTGVTTFTGEIDLTQVAAGDDIQVIEAERDVFGNFITGRGIGSIAAGRNWGNENLGILSRIFVNVDDINDDGFVDLLSVGGDVGGGDTTAGGGVIVGGPAIDVGTNGNFRYFDVGENASVLRDPQFGTFPTNQYQEVPLGESFEYTDDSGTRVRISTEEGEPDPAFDITFNPFDIPIVGAGQLEVLTYPVRSGGSILVNVRSTRSVGVQTLDRGQRATAEVGNIFLTGTNGRPVLFEVDNDDPGFDDVDQTVVFGAAQDLPFDFNNPNADLSPFDDYEVRLAGRNVDVFGVNQTGGGDGRVTRIVNDSDGEVLDTRLTSVGLIQAERVGIAETRGFADLQVAQPLLAGNFPFDQNPHIIAVEGSIGSIVADTVGNVFAGVDLGIGVTEGVTFLAGAVEDGFDDAAGDGINSQLFVTADGDVDEFAFARIGEPRGVIGSIRADAFGGGRFERDQFGFGRDDEFRFEGIAGPIVAATPGTPESQGEIRFVDIGEGIADDGSGTISGGGLYAETFILTVFGDEGANIYGDIVANEVNRVTLNGGSLIGADILQAEIAEGGTIGQIDFGLAREFDPTATVVFEFADTENNPVFEVDLIELNGGGIIGSQVQGSDVDRVVVNDGYGILRSNVSAILDDSVVNRVSVDGLGIRNSQMTAGLNIGSISASGDQTPIDVSQFDSTVRLSDQGFTFSPFDGRQINGANDLRVAIGLPADVNIRPVVTADGVIENLILTASRDLSSYSASVSRSNPNTISVLPGFEDDTAAIGTGSLASEAFPNTVSVGRNISDYDVDDFLGFRSVSGEINRLDASDEVTNALFRVSGRIQDTRVGGLFNSNATLRAEGPDGSIGRVQAGELLGTVRADIGIEEIVVDGDLGSPNAAPITSDDPSLANVRAGGFGQADAPILRLFVGGDVLTGTFIRATDQIEDLTINGDIQVGARIQAEEIDSLDLGGSNFGTIIRS
ncbi:MAG: hypothetical protein AAGI46_03275 [Planctomycetota bacterium]